MVLVLYWVWSKEILKWSKCPSGLNNWSWIQSIIFLWSDNVEVRDGILCQWNEVNKSQYTTFLSLWWSHCHNLLRDQIKLDPIYISMLEETEPCKQANATILYLIIKRLCNGATIVESLKRTMLESLFNLSFIIGDDYNSLQGYTDVFKQHATVVEEFGWLFSTTKLRDLCIEESKHWRDKSDTATALLA